MKTEISKSKEEVTLTMNQTEVIYLQELSEFVDFISSGRTNDDLFDLSFIFQIYVEARPGGAKEAMALFGKISQMYHAFTYHGEFANKTYSALHPVSDKF